LEHRIELLDLHEQVKQVGHRGESTEWAEWEVSDWLTVYATKEFARDPAVFLGRGESAGAKLTPAEARTLAVELLLVADECDT
jgi:hypothetical protein